jgi:hypothetical protein
MWPDCLLICAFWGGFGGLCYWATQGAAWWEDDCILPTLGLWWATIMLMGSVWAILWPVGS